MCCVSRYAPPPLPPSPSLRFPSPLLSLSFPGAEGSYAQDRQPEDLRPHKYQYRCSHIHVPLCSSMRPPSKATEIKQLYLPQLLCWRWVWEATTWQLLPSQILPGW